MISSERKYRYSIIIYNGKVIEKCKLQSNDASLLETVYAKDRYPVAYASYMSKKKANDALLTYNMQN